MHELNTILRKDAIVRILLDLLPIPALPDHIQTSGPGLRIIEPTL